MNFSFYCCAWLNFVKYCAASKRLIVVSSVPLEYGVVPLRSIILNDQHLVCRHSLSFELLQISRAETRNYRYEQANSVPLWRYNEKKEELRMILAYS